MKRSFYLLGIAALYAMVFSCEAPPAGNAETVNTAAASLTPLPLTSSAFEKSSVTLDKYWYQGKGELNVYELEQNRYQGIHPGEALLIFVTEDFLTDKQVKNDSYKNPNSTAILKMNGITRFTTGLYDYSIMTSVFTPVKSQDFSRTLKVTQSAQDWCGQVFSQINLQNEQYQYKLFSYFESEGDEQKEAAANFLEDEVMNRIRMDYSSLPVGDDLKVIPGLTFLRLRHQSYQAYTANASLTDYAGTEFSGEALKVYTVEYPEFKRTLNIVFSSVAPYYIEGWIDEYPSAFDGKLRATKATRKKTIQDDYWSKNRPTAANASLRNELGWD
jgi:hypothetical protein